MPKGRHSKIKTCDPFCPQSRKDSEVKPHQPENRPYKENDDMRVPRKWKALQYLLEHDGKSNISNAEEQRKQITKISNQIKKTAAQQERSENFTIKKKIKKEDQELARLLKEKKRLEGMLK